MNSQRQVRPKNRRTPLKKQARTRPPNRPSPPLNGAAPCQLPAPVAIQGQPNPPEVSGKLLDAIDELDKAAMQTHALLKVVLDRLLAEYGKCMTSQRRETLPTLADDVLFHLAKFSSNILDTKREHLPELKKFAQQAAVLLLDFSQEFETRSLDRTDFDMFFVSGLWYAADLTADRLLSAVQDLSGALDWETAQEEMLPDGWELYDEREFWAESVLVLGGPTDKLRRDIKQRLFLTRYSSRGSERRQIFYDEALEWLKGRLAKETQSERPPERYLELFGITKPRLP
jgi:hypothetical protein